MLVVVAIIAVVLAIASIVVTNRVSFVTLSPTADDTDQVFLLIGNDAGIARPENDLQASGARADVIIVARMHDGVATAVVIPRDLVVTTPSGVPARVALMMNDGASAVADALCRDLGISVDHVVAIESAGFIGAVDALGGMEVAIAHPVDDPGAGLHLAEAGSQALTGQATLALVRSRHPEYFIGDEWVPVSEVDGARVRAESTRDVAHALANAVRAADVPQLLLAAWESSDGLIISHGTMPWDLLALAKVLDTPAVLPTRSLTPGFEAANDATITALEDAGFSPICSHL